MINVVGAGNSCDQLKRALSQRELWYQVFLLEKHRDPPMFHHPERMDFLDQSSAVSLGCFT